MRNRRKKIAYVSGKYRDRRGPHFIFKNIVEAREVAAELWAMGYVVICPHTNSIFMDGAVDGDSVWIDGSKELVVMSDLVVMLPKWEESIGATAERKEALDNGIPVFRWPEHANVLARIANEPITAITRQILQFNANLFDCDDGCTFMDSPRRIRVSIDGGDAELYDVVNMDKDMLVLRKTESSENNAISANGKSKTSQHVETSH